MKSSSLNRKLTFSGLSIALFIAAWAVAAACISSEHILPGPWTTFVAAAGIIVKKGFLATVGSTLLRGLAGFSAALAAGVGLGVCGGLHNDFRSFMKPLVVIIRSTPVVAFILMALIWFKSDSVAVFIGFLTMFPIIYGNVVEGMISVDPKLLEMAVFHKVGIRRTVREVYLPAITPFLTSGISTAVGIGWRAVVVGEVLSLPQFGIGTVMHSAQVFLQVDLLIAWTFVTIILGWVFESLIRLIRNRLIKW